MYMVCYLMTTYVDHYPYKIRIPVDLRGTRGARGPRGPRGPHAPDCVCNECLESYNRGLHGERGARGARGASGARGPDPSDLPIGCTTYVRYENDFWSWRPSWHTIIMTAVVVIGIGMSVMCS